MFQLKLFVDAIVTVAASECSRVEYCPTSKRCDVRRLLCQSSRLCLHYLPPLRTWHRRT